MSTIELDGASHAPGELALPVISDDAAVSEESLLTLRLLKRVEETWGQPGHPVEYLAYKLPEQRRWEYETTIKLLDVSEGARLLDVGGGSGYLAYIMSDCCRVLFNERHDIYKQPAAPVQKIIGSFLTLVEAEPIFDAVACVSVLEHVPPSRRAAWLEKTCRLLKPGGFAVFTFEWHPVEVFDIKDGFTLTTQQLTDLYDSKLFRVVTQMVSPVCAHNSRGWIPMAVKIVSAE